MDAEIDRESYAALAKRCEAWKELAGCLQELSVVYFCQQSPEITLLNRIHRLQERLGIERT